MILPIYVYGQPVLRKVAEDITPDYPNLKELIANMFETMVARTECSFPGKMQPELHLSNRNPRIPA